MIIKPYEMAAIYWSRLKGGSIHEVQFLIDGRFSEKSKPYWNEVLAYLIIKKNRGRS